MGLTTPVGRILGGRYQILKHLATGGMADVYLARTTGLEGFERHVVVKWIRAEDARDEMYVRMFLDEARVAASLHHHNIVQVHDVGHEDDEYFFAMEYVHGVDARDLLTRSAQRKQHIPIDHLLAIISAAAMGLHCAHEVLGPDRQPLGLVHRDVSPSNILIGFDGSVKLTDFGIAKASQRSGETRSGSIKGKVAYMSPEQCRGEAIDRRSDIFALGIVFYELATARRLFKADSDFLTMSTIVSGTVPPPSRFRPDLPPAVEAVILRALAADRDRRFATMEDLRTAIERCAIELDLRMSAASLVSYLRSVFGERPEPWRLAGALDAAPAQTPEGSASGSGSGPGVVPLQDLPLAGVGEDAPIRRAHQRMVTSAPSVTDDEPVFGASAPVDNASLAPRRRGLWIALGVAAAAGIALALLWPRSDGTASAAATTPPTGDPPATIEKAPEPRPEPKPAVVAEPPAPQPVAEPAKKTPPPKPAAVRPAPAKTTPPPAPPKKTPPPVKPKDAEWDRSALFPK